MNASKIILAVSFLSLSACVSFAQQKNVPRLDWAGPCPIEVQKEVPNDCGFLIVWENRETRNRTIRIPFIRLKTQSQNAKPDPILYTAGGPGVSSLRRARGAANLKPYMAERDFIVFEQRGTTFAEPSLECPEVDEAIRESGLAGLTENAAIAKEVGAAEKCRRRLTINGIDLAAYDSRASAADIEDLRKLLAIKKWNLFGISYSTRLMLNVMREYPEGLRSVVLDSVLPPSANWDETGIDGVVRSLNYLFEVCAQDKQCAQKYPAFDKTFYSTVRNLNNKPLTLQITDETSKRKVAVKINGADIIAIAYDALNYPDGVSGLPAKIKAVSEGRIDVLESYAKAKIGGDGFIWGMRYSVWCREEMPFQQADRISAQKRRYSRLKGFTIQPALPGICEVWDVPPADPVENEPVVSDIPTLVLSGSFDPNTPPEWGRLVAENLSQSYFIEFPEMGHLINFNSRCGINMIGAFFIDPSKAPDASCIAKEKRVVFK